MELGRNQPISFFTLAISTLSQYGPLNLRLFFIRRWAEPHYLGACASFLFSPPLIAPQISALREEGDLTETVVTRFALYLRLCFGLQSLFILKYIRMYVVRSR